MSKMCSNTLLKPSPNQLKVNKSFMSTFNEGHTQFCILPWWSGKHRDTVYLWFFFQVTLTIAACLATPRANKLGHIHTTQHCTAHSSNTAHTERRCDNSLQAVKNQPVHPAEDWRLYNTSCNELHVANDGQQQTARVDSLLCAVDELVLVGPLEAGLHSFVVPQLLRVIKELL